MNPGIDRYLSDGCGRCELGGTPRCKVHNWPQELIQLRKIILDCGLTEELKWSIPCYTFQNSNIITMSAFKEYCAISFFKGALLKDVHEILEKPGQNTQAGRLIRFTNVQKIMDMAPILKDYIREAIDIEKAGLKVHFKKNPEPVPEELQKAMDKNPALRDAFQALTPGRQRGYILYFSAAKQSKTRESRIEKCIPKIFDGLGLTDY